MGAQQVLRVAVGVAVVATAPAVARANPDEPVVIVDLRAGNAADFEASRAKLREDLAGIQGIAISTDKELDAALSGAAVDADATRVERALEEARTAFGKLDCGTASAAADRAIEDLAARQAAGLDDGKALKTAYAYVVLCADRAGDLGSAIRAAGRLRALGVTSGEDVGISDATWQRLPEIDATGGEIVAVTIEADQPDAAVWVDHVAVGKAPVTVYVAAGEHVIAAAAGPNRAATRTEVSGRTAALALALPDQRGTWSEIAGFIHAWKDKVTPPTNAGLTAIMAAARTRFAIVLAGSKTAEVWGKGPNDQVAKKIDTVALAEPMEIAVLITDRVAVWDGRTPGEELLTETDAERADHYGRGEKPQKAKWYVYASIAGAVLVGGLVIYFNDAADDTQRIVIQGP
jgi:hypothetical protein